MRIYSSFSQIDRDLKVLKLQSEINKEELMLSVNNAKDSFSPVSTIASLLGSIAQKVLVAKFIGKVVGYPRVKRID